MSNVYNTIGFLLLSLEDFENVNLAREVISILFSGSEELQPQIYNCLKGEKRIESMDELTDIFMGEGRYSNHSLIAKLSTLILSRNNHCYYQISWDKILPKFRPSPQMISGSLTISMLKEKPLLLSEFITQIKRLTEVSKPVYGDFQSRAIKGWDNPIDLEVRLPDIRPVSIYGPPYVELFGREAIESAPFQKIEEIAPGYYWLEANDSVFEPVPEETKAAIRKHFGEDAFMVGRRYRHKSGRAPKLDFRNTFVSQPQE
jgi:hypothetical protein